MTHPEDATPEITAEALVRSLESGEALQVVDVRRPERVREGRIDLVPDARFHNHVGSSLLARSDLAGLGLSAELPAVVVCGAGNDSRTVAAHLRGLGLDARSLRGGMTAWMNVVLARPIAPPETLDRLVQFDRVGKGALGYLLVSDGEALVVDPPRDYGAYLAAARNAGARITAVADTHVHADYISGAPALARELRVPYHLHPADAVYPYDGTPGRLSFEPLEDGKAIRVGRCVLAAVHTPGHTEGSTTFRAGDDLLLTGDFVFVDSLGRPDLAGRAGEWWAWLWESVERARREWPAGATVLPAHYASERERAPDRSVRASFGELLRSNAGLAMRDREAFRRWASEPAAFPEGYRTIKAVNVALKLVTEEEAAELEVGRNECAVIRPAG